MSGAHRRVELAGAYVLHHQPWRDTSRILEMFSRDHGRLTLFARGVRGPKSRSASLLQPFRMLLVSWSVASIAYGPVSQRAGGRKLPYIAGLLATTALWAALADQDAAVFRRVLADTAAKPARAAWVNYVRCHDDIIWNALAGHASADDLHRWVGWVA